MVLIFVPVISFHEEYMSAKYKDLTAELCIHLKLFKLETSFESGI